MNQTSNAALIEAKTRKENASADRIEFQLAIMRKEYVKVSDVNKLWSENAAKVRTKLLAMSSRVAPRLAAQPLSVEDIKFLIDSVVYEALSELADTYEVKS